MPHKNEIKRGKFIVMEGLDGSGKTTQIGLLAAHLKSRGHRVHLTAEPTVSTTGGMLRDALGGVTQKTACELAAMFVLDRIFHNVNPVSGIEKMLAEGYDVICDRYYYSSLAYQGSMTDFEWVKNMNIGCPQIRQPDLCIFLDLDPELCMQRIGADRTTTEIFEKKETLARVRERYMQIFGSLEDRVAVIDTAPDIETVGRAVCAAADTLWNE